MGTLVGPKIASRDASNASNRLRAAALPMTKTLEKFVVRASSFKQNTFDYLSSLESVRAKENLRLAGPAARREPPLIGSVAPPSTRAIGCATSVPSNSWRPFCRGITEDSVGRIIEGILKADLILIDETGFVPMDHTRAQLLFRAEWQQARSGRPGPLGHQPQRPPGSVDPGGVAPYLADLDTTATRPCPRHGLRRPACGRGRQLQLTCTMAFSRVRIVGKVAPSASFRWTVRCCPECAAYVRTERLLPATRMLRRPPGSNLGIATQRGRAAKVLRAHRPSSNLVSPGFLGDS